MRSASAVYIKVDWNWFLELITVFDGYKCVENS